MAPNRLSPADDTVPSLVPPRASRAATDREHPAPPPPPARQPGRAPRADAVATSPRAGAALVWRIFIATASVVVVVLAMVLGVVTASAERAADEALARGLASARQHVVALLDGRTRALQSGAVVFAQNPEFRSLVLEGRRDDLVDQAIEAATRIGATWVQITDADGVRLAKSDEPGAPPATLAGTALVGGALGGAVVAGAGVAGDSAVIDGVAVPILIGPQVAGVLMAAQTMNADVAREIRRATSSEVMIYRIDDEGAAHPTGSTLAAAAHRRLLSQVAPPPTAPTPAADSAAPVAIEIGGTAYVAQQTLLRSATGDPVGGVITLRSRDVELAPFAALRRRIVVVGGAGLALAFALAFGVAREITRPILALRDAARRVAAGDFSSAEVRVESSGEVGELADAVRSVLSNVHERHALAALVERARTTAPPAAEHPAPTLPHALPPSFAPGSTLARRYTVDGLLGVGGNGVVYRAIDEELGETIAIKTLRPEALAGGPEALDRLKEEIRLARRIAHAGVVRIHDLGEADGTYFITMEYVAGMSLSDLLKRVRWVAPAQGIMIGKQLAAALAAAHAQGVIHRDVKPPNLILQPDGALKVMDFGVARLAERASGLTEQGLIVGTPAYMAPEQLLDEPVDARADVYAAGVVLYESLTGRRPFEAPTVAAYIARAVADTPAAPAAVNPAVPVALSDAVLRALARDPADRPRGAAELHDMLVRAQWSV